MPVGFRAIMMSFLRFLSQGKFLKPEIILSRTYLRKLSIWPPSIIINLLFVKNAITSELLGVRG